MTRRLLVRFPLHGTALAIFLCCLLTLPAHAQTGSGRPPAGLSHDEAMRLGELMYRTGVLPSGEPMQAIVKGDVPVDGGMFTCASCHLRSGFGSSEGTIRTPPIDGTRLYSVLSSFKGIPRKTMPAGEMNEGIYRPAYTDETLARVILSGEDPMGRKINDAMPVYLLNDRDAAVLVYYLKHLSTGGQPGVTDTTLRFATIVTEGVPKEQRDAMLTPLQAYIRNWRIPKPMERSLRAESGIMEGALKGMRSRTLSVWELNGPPNTWRAQLEEHYRKEPVFAVLGGLAAGDWTPVHRFCEDHRIPAVFPFTEHPVVSGSDRYTLYLSKGLYQEGEAVARYLNAQEIPPADAAIVQVYRKDAAGQALSRGFDEAWKAAGHAVPEHLVLRKDEKMTAGLWKKIAGKRAQAVVLLWLDDKGLSPFEALAQAGKLPAMVFTSSSLLGQRIFSLPERVRPHVFLSYPYAIPGAPRPVPSGTTDRGRTAEPEVVADIRRKIQHLVATISGPLTRMRALVYREYFIELIEESADQYLSQGAYPRLSFGTGQRYASKGCYIVQVAEGPDLKLIKKGDWVIH